jgi:hypothetical protein
MKLHLGQPLYSATDLLNFLGCTHATALDIQVMGRALAAPRSAEDAYLEILKEKGLDHERLYLEELKAEGRLVVEIERDPSIEAMAERARTAGTSDSVAFRLSVGHGDRLNLVTEMPIQVTDKGLEQLPILTVDPRLDLCDQDPTHCLVPVDPAGMLHVPPATLLRPNKSCRTPSQ